jgi:AcrR family transcriptional regulator
MNTHEKHLPADERKVVIVEAVIELAAEQNPHGITTAAIANRMGLTQGALFRHFPNKAAILKAVMIWTSEHLLAELDKSLLGITSPVDGLRAMFIAHAQFVTEHPGVPRLLFGELQQTGKTASKDVVQSLLKNYKERLHQLIESGKSSQELDMSLDTGAAAILFIGTIQGLIMQSLLAGDVSLIRQDALRVFDIYHRGIRRIS